MFIERVKIERNEKRRNGKEKKKQNNTDFKCILACKHISCFFRCFTFILVACTFHILLCLNLLMLKLGPVTNILLLVVIRQPYRILLLYLIVTFVLLFCFLLCYCCSIYFVFCCRCCCLQPLRGKSFFRRLRVSPF